MPHLREIDIDEIALVKSDAEPVNDEARIELVKAQAAASTEPVADDQDESLVQRIAKAIKAVFVAKADAEGGDDGDGDNDAVAVSESGTHGAYDGTHAHDHQDGAGGMHGHAHSHDGDGDHGHSHVRKAQDAVTLVGALDSVLDELEKADVGAAQMALARGHVAAMRKEAQAFIRTLQQSGANPHPNPVSDGVSMAPEDQVQGDQIDVTPEDIGKAITEALAAALPEALAAAVAPLKEQAAEVAKAHLQDSLPGAVKEAVDAAVKDVKDAVSGEVTAQVAPIAKAVEDAQAEEARKRPATVPILNGPGLAHQARSAKEVGGMTYSSALRELLHD